MAVRCRGKKEANGAVAAPSAESPEKRIEREPCTAESPAPKSSRTASRRLTDPAGARSSDARAAGKGPTAMILRQRPGNAPFAAGPRGLREVLPLRASACILHPGGHARSEDGQLRTMLAGR